MQTSSRKPQPFIVLWWPRSAASALPPAWQCQVQWPQELMAVPLTQRTGLLFNRDGESTVAEKHLVAAIGRKYGKMSRTQRIKTIRDLSEDGLRFMRQFFPEFYAEAFPAPKNADCESWESDSRPALYAKSR
jgi:hypothetical protein